MNYVGKYSLWSSSGQPKQYWIRTAIISAAFCLQICEWQVPVRAHCVLVRKAGCCQVWDQVIIHNCGLERGLEMSFCCACTSAGSALYQWKLPSPRWGQLPGLDRVWCKQVQKLIFFFCPLVNQCLSGVASTPWANCSKNVAAPCGSCANGIKPSCKPGGPADTPPFPLLVLSRCESAPPPQQHYGMLQIH